MSAKPADDEAPRGGLGPAARATALLVLAVLLRLSFWAATPDHDQPYPAFYKGDAPLWVEYARAIQQDRPFELDLPLRPPGMAYALAAIWPGGPSFTWPHLVWCVLGAGIAPLLYLGLRRGVGERRALLAGVFTAVSTALILLSSSLNNETPYLLLVTASLWGVDRLRASGHLVHVALWSGLQGIACLLRVEHALYFALCLGWLLLGWRARDAARPWRFALPRTALAVLAFSAPLLPWHLAAWRAIERFNTLESSPLPAAQLRWDADARAAALRLPGFARGSAALFVEACVRHRGGAQVRLEDLDILDEAYGCRPEPLQAHPFVALYGPLNFGLANCAGADGGFSRAALAAPPPLSGGRDRFDPLWLDNLPQGSDLALQYPPHLRMVNHGYALGLAWLAGHPVDGLALVGRKLSITWAGAAHGLGGHALPLGLSGLRRRVDLVVPESTVATAWRLLVLALCLGGLPLALRIPAAWPWLLWLVSKLCVTALFFGYARQGALCVPAVALLCALALDRYLLARAGDNARKKITITGLALLAVLLGADVYRFARPPTVLVDGREHGAHDPWPPFEFEDRRIELR